jgi:predicted nucleotidyltransferase
MLTESTIREAARRMAAVAHAPIRIILFGSYARGDADEGSDLDLMVVEKEIPDYTREYLRLREAIDELRMGIGVDLLIYPEAEFEKRQDWWSTPVYWAVREGKVLYESAH